jgi:hypothetical protein
MKGFLSFVSNDGYKVRSLHATEIEEKLAECE